MEVIYRRCCGLDVHKQTVIACLWIGYELPKFRLPGEGFQILLENGKAGCENYGSLKSPIGSFVIQYLFGVIHEHPENI
jgi:hypothetical protein